MLFIVKFNLDDNLKLIYALKVDGDYQNLVLCTYDELKFTQSLEEKYLCYFSNFLIDLSNIH